VNPAGLYSVCGRSATTLATAKVASLRLRRIMLLALCVAWSMDTSGTQAADTSKPPTHVPDSLAPGAKSPPGLPAGRVSITS